MSMETTNQISLDDNEVGLLTELLELNLDTQNGYKAAADAVQNADYADLFRQFSQERRQIATELTRLLQANGENPPKAGTLPGMFHQGWINLDSILSSGDAAIFGECERVDALTLSAYQSVMGQTSREELMEILRRQFTDIRNAHDRVKVLRGALEQASR